MSINSHLLPDSETVLIIMMCEYSSVRQKNKISNAKALVLALLTTAHVEKFVD